MRNLANIYRYSLKPLMEYCSYILRLNLSIKNYWLLKTLNWLTRFSNIWHRKMKKMPRNTMRIWCFKMYFKFSRIPVPAETGASEINILRWFLTVFFFWQFVIKKNLYFFVCDWFFVGRNYIPANLWLAVWISYGINSTIICWSWFLVFIYYFAKIYFKFLMTFDFN